MSLDFLKLLLAIAGALLAEKWLLDRLFDWLAARARDREPRRQAQLTAIVIGRIERKS